jgi:hypothetical protein
MSSGFQVVNIKKRNSEDHTVGVVHWNTLVQARRNKTTVVLNRDTHQMPSEIYRIVEPVSVACTPYPHLIPSEQTEVSNSRFERRDTPDTE